MTVRKWMHALAGLVLIAVGGCDDATGPEDAAELRAVHMSPDAPALSVLLDGEVLESGLTYRQGTAYASVATPVQVNVHDATGRSLLSARLSLDAGRPHTLLVLNRLATIQALLLVDDPTSAGNNARARVVHAAPSLGSVDIYITAPDAELAGATPALTGVTFRGVSNYLVMAGGTHRLRATAAGTTTVLLDANPLAAPAGSVRTIVLGEAPGGGAPFSVVLVEDG